MFRCSGVYVLTAVSQKVHPNSTAFKRTGSASSRLRFDPRPKLRPMAPKPGVGTWVLLKGRVLTILVFGIGFGLVELVGGIEWIVVMIVWCWRKGDRCYWEVMASLYQYRVHTPYSIFCIKFVNSGSNFICMTQ